MDDVPCPMCGHAVDWVTTDQIVRDSGLGQRRVNQLCQEGRFPGASKFNFDGKKIWRIPLAAYAAFMEAREAQ